MPNGDTVLQVKNLEISFRTYAGEVQAVRGVTFDLRRGETLAIVGESGSGKSVTAKSIMRLLPEANSLVKGGEILFDGRDLLSLSDKQMQDVRGPKIAMVFQDPMTSLDPTMRVGRQITESLKKHLGMSGNRARERAVELLEMVGIPNAEDRVKQYPHQFSGGMRQRVVIAIAVACDPQILIADEPTTALDVTIQAQILELLRDLQERIGTSVILITHDLGVVASTARRVVVMYGGKIVETGTVREIFYNPQMPYTWGLLSSIPLPTADRSQDLIPIPGSPPDMLEPPKGCPFTPRCPYAMQICAEEMPEYTTFSAEHRAACWLQHPMAPDVEPPVKVTDAR
ncbi:MAG TPA: ABC transporter ATP-binding protein [Rubrobacteraceae bacterium]|nr:ABC transporter ATP-binding protein [Rubrobacteraceae bacterium]